MFAGVPAGDINPPIPAHAGIASIMHFPKLLFPGACPFNFSIDRIIPLNNAHVAKLDINAEQNAIRNPIPTTIFFELPRVLEMMALVRKTGIFEFPTAIVIPEEAMMNNDVLTPIFAIASSKDIILNNARRQIRSIVVIDIGNASVAHKTNAENSKQIPSMVNRGRMGTILAPKEMAISIPAIIRPYSFFLEILVTMHLPILP